MSTATLEVELSTVGANDLTDLANARRLIREHGQDLRWCEPWKTWLVWDGCRWVEDQTRHAERLAKKTADTMWRELSFMDSDMRKIWVKHATRSAQAGGLAAMLDLARSEPDVPVMPERLNSDPWLLNVSNGTLDLQTGVLRPHDRLDLITKLADVEWVEGAECPTWIEFLTKSLCGDLELLEFLQRASGYSMTGRSTEEYLLFLWGPGRNGKSKFLNALVELLGDYGRAAPADLLVDRNGDSHPQKLADLFGRRMVTTIEVPGGRMNSELMKQLTGGDILSARRMRENQWQFLPTHTLWMAANHEPVISDATASVWERVLKIPFPYIVPEGERDKGLADKLRLEFSGILRWMLQGCLQWQEQGGLNPPASVRKATAEYKSNMDWLQDWLDQACIVSAGTWSYTGSLYHSYCEWARENGFRQPVSAKRLTQLLRDRGYEYSDQHGPSRKGAFVGLGLVVPF